MKDRGFTLIELIVAMVILAVLAAIAIPSYSSYVLRSHRTEAKSTLLDAASLEERYFSTSNTYSANATDLGYSAGPPTVVGSGYYEIFSIAVVAAVAPGGAFPNGVPASYTITVKAIGQQTNDTACATFTVNSAGLQTAFTAAAAPNTATCWQN